MEIEEKGERGPKKYFENEKKNQQDKNKKNGFMDERKRDPRKMTTLLNKCGFTGEKEIGFMNVNRKDRLRMLRTPAKI